MMGREGLKWAVGVGVLVAACGGERPPPETPREQAASPVDKGEELSVEGAVGALDKEAVQERAGKVRRKAEACVEEARSGLPFLGGDIDVFVRVDASGRAIDAFAERSTLGHRETEHCILEAFRAQQWPRPVGGKVGELSQSLGFQAGYDEPPEAWDGEALSGAMSAEGGAALYQGMVDQLAECAPSGDLLVTMYLDEDGFVQGVGMSGGSDLGDEAAQCVSTVVQTTSFPSAGKLVKATVRVP